ncbi:MAG: hypothetical protein ABSF76_10375 [Opitutaceae bacterium]|jgi:hypothetical protein
MLFMPPVWRSFSEITADAEAAFASSSSRFSLTTLEVTSDPGFSGFALTERRQCDMWRWALVSAEGPVVDEGWEPTESDAKKSAVGAMRHWLSGIQRGKSTLLAIV